MLEIEAKVKVDSLDTVAQQLKSLDATHVDKLVQWDSYFDGPRKHLLMADKGIRMRQQSSDGPDKSILTYKGPRGDSDFKSRPEYEVQVDDRDKMALILEGLGYESTVGLEKRRDVWQLDDCLVMLDEVAMLGCFVEVEAADEAQIEAVLKKLGLSKIKHISDGYASLLIKMLEKEGVDSREIRLEGNEK